jgi:hypothetical protein
LIKSTYYKAPLQAVKLKTTKDFTKPIAIIGEVLDSVKVFRKQAVGAALGITTWFFLVDTAR